MNNPTFEVSDAMGGGLNPVTDENRAGTVTVYIETVNVTYSLKKIEQAGGTIVSPEIEIPTTGNFGLFRDPDGNLVGLFMPYPMPQ